MILGKIGGFLGKIRALLGKMLNEIKITSEREKKGLNLLHKNIKNALKCFIRSKNVFMIIERKQGITI